MYHNPSTLRKQQGSAIIIAIFIIIIISLLGAALASLQRDSAQGTSYEVYAARAYLSAYAAGELALVALFPLDSTDRVCSGVETPVNLGSDIGFHGCSAVYACETLIPAASNSASLATRYKIVSTAVCENAQTITRRQITLEATSL